MKSHIETTVILSLLRRVTTVEGNRKRQQSLKHRVTHHYFVQYYVRKEEFLASERVS